MNKIIFVSSPLRGDVQANIEKACGYCKWVVNKFGYIPFAPHIYFTRFLDQNNAKERALGMEFGMDVMHHCDQVWVFGDVISEGMKREIEYAQSMGKPIKYHKGIDIKRKKFETACEEISGDLNRDIMCGKSSPLQNS